MLLLFEAAHLMTSDSHNVVICPLVESHLVLELNNILLWGKNLKKNIFPQNFSDTETIVGIAEMIQMEL